MKLLWARVRKRSRLILLLVALASVSVGYWRWPEHVVLHLRAPRDGVDAALASPLLELHFHANPYWYEVVEKSSGKVLVAQAQTTLTPSGASNRIVTITRATEVRRQADILTARLTSADQPGSAVVLFRFTAPEVLTVTIARQTRPHRAPGAVSEEFLDQGERYYGLWEFPFGGEIDNRGAEAPLLSPGYQKQVHHASARAPFYVSSAGYGVYAQTDAHGDYHVARHGRTGFRFFQDELTYHILYGPTYAGVMERYNRLAGPARVPPTWALGSIWWRDNAHLELRPGITNSQQNVEDDARQLQERRIPASAIWIDRPFGTGKQGWGSFDFDRTYPDPREMVRALDARGIRLMVWMANRFWKLTSDQRKRWLLAGPRAKSLDLRQPAARAWMIHGLEKFGALGVRGYKIDRGDEGDVPIELQNHMATMVAKAAGDSLTPASGNQWFLLARNVHDTSRRYAAVWNGDVIGSFAGLRMSLENGIRCGAMNFPVWGSDTGGLLSPWAHMDAVPPSKELMARWLEFSAYTPVMEVLIGPQRTPWADYDRELLEITRNCAATHHDLIPYVRSCLQGTARTGLAPIRPLVFDYPDDESLADRWDEYLYGGNILVAPAIASLRRTAFGHNLEFNPGYIPHVSIEAADREVYLPRGSWAEYPFRNRKDLFTGPITLTLHPGLADTPAFVREGAIIPRGDVLKANNNWTANWRPHLRVEVFPAARSDSRFDYYAGEEAPALSGKPRAITCAHHGDALTVSCEDLGAAGDFEIYCRSVNSVRRNGQPLVAGSDYQYDAAGEVLRVPFAGRTTVEIPGAASLFP